MTLAQFGFLLPSDVRSEFGFQTATHEASPAAGTSFVRKVPGEFFEVPVSVYANLTTDATVATRQMWLQVYNGDLQFVSGSIAALSQSASQSVDYQWSLAVTGAYTVGANRATMPGLAMVLPSGYYLFITVQNMQAGDQIFSPSFVLQQYETGIEPEVFRTLLPALPFSGEVASPLATSLSLTSTSTPLDGSLAPTPSQAAPPTPSATPTPPTPTPPAPIIVSRPPVFSDRTPGTFTIKAE